MRRRYVVDRDTTPADLDGPLTLYPGGLTHAEYLRKQGYNQPTLTEQIAAKAQKEGWPVERVPEASDY